MGSNVSEVSSAGSAHGYSLHNFSTTLVPKQGFPLPLGGLHYLYK